MGRTYLQELKAAAEHFTFYLLDKGYLDEKYEIEKEKMKEILLQEYTAEHLMQIDSPTMTFALNRNKLTKKKKKSTAKIVSFRYDKIQELIKAGSPKLGSALSKPVVKVTADQLVFFKKVEKPEVLNNIECKLCGVTFTNHEAHTIHEKEDLHIIREYYMKRKFVKDKSKISILVREEENGIIPLRPKTHGVASFQIHNTAVYDVELTEIIPIIETEEVIFPQPQLPLVIKAGCKLIFELGYAFKYPGAYHFAIGFIALSDPGVEYLVKELVFQVQSEIMDTLKPTEPFKKKLKAVIKHEEAPVIYGKPLPVISSSLEQKRRLSGFDLEPSLNRILNNGLKPFKEMKPKDIKKLKEVRALLKLDLDVTDVNSLLNEACYSRLFNLLLYIEEHKINMEIRLYDRENVTLKAVPGQQNLLSLQDEGFAEKRPSVLRGDKVFVHIEGDNSVRYEGIVHQVRRNEAWIAFHKKLMSKFENNLKFHVEYSFNRQAFRIQHRAVEFAQQHHLKSVLFPTVGAVKTVPKVNITHWYNKKISKNEEQKLAVCSIVSGSSYPAPYLIFGPPGTGKTVTLVEAITQLYYVKEKVCHILVCTPSNPAADEITRRLVQSINGSIPDGDVFRMYAVSYNSEAIPSEFGSCCNYDNKNKEYYYPSLTVIQKYRIVVTTLMTAGRLVSADPPMGHFTHVFIDEAGQAVEPETLVPIAGLLSTRRHKGQIFGQIVLAGDPKQLGPVLRSTMASELGLGMSLLERLMTRCDLYKRDESTNKYNSAVLVKLVRNFRSHKAIIAVPNELFYDNELQAVGNPLVNLACSWRKLPRKGFPVIFHAVFGNNEREANSPSYFNRLEIDVVLNYVNDLLRDKLRGRKVTGKDIGIVTPYRKQVEKFRKAFERDEDLNQITVGCVEEFQGQEHPIIIISTVRSRKELVEHDYKYNLGFLNNPKRFNVAVTRAQSLLIVVGDPHILQFDATWRRFIQFCRENGGCRGCKFTFTKESPIVPKAFDLSSLRTALNDVGSNTSTQGSMIW